MAMLRAGKIFPIGDTAEIGLALRDARLMDELVSCGRVVSPNAVGDLQRDGQP
jgi:hypothetical protein